MKFCVPGGAPGDDYETMDILDLSKEESLFVKRALVRFWVRLLQWEEALKFM